MSLERKAHDVAAPEVLAGWIRRWAGAPEAGANAPAPALVALDEALKRPGRSREAAEALLASDALLTDLVEAAADQEDPGTILDDLVSLIARRGSG
ncbi:MAG: hypothetical protein EA351_02905 [Gemmatimonadales bacterium]|nr:MAG: hypothetical protein EA351_02905 [Gemmatimonadales bacterium]